VNEYNTPFKKKYTPVQVPEHQQLQEIIEVDEDGITAIHENLVKSLDYQIHQVLNLLH
jgi:hypothetical protein